MFCQIKNEIVFLKRWFWERWVKTCCQNLPHIHCVVVASLHQQATLQWSVAIVSHYWQHGSVAPSVKGKCVFHFHIPLSSLISNPHQLPKQWFLLIPQPKGKDGVESWRAVKRWDWFEKEVLPLQGIGRSNWQCEHSFGQDMDKQQSGQTLSE